MKAQAAASGGDEVERCAAPTRTARMETADYADWSRLGACYRTQKETLCFPSGVSSVLYVLYVLPRRLSGTSQTCRGCRENFSLPGRGAAPHIPISQSPNQPIPFCVLCVLCDFQSILAVLLPSWFFVSAPQGKPSTPSQRPRPLRLFVSSWKEGSDFSCILAHVMLSSSPAMETQPGFRHPFVYEKARTITCLTSRAPPSV